MKKQLMIFTFLALICLNTKGQDVKENNVRELLDLIGTRSQLSFAINKMVELYKDQWPDTPEAVWDSLNIIFNESIDDFYEKAIPLYTKYFSDDEILQLIDFYKSPIGQKYLMVLPQITEESMKLGTEWGQSLQPRLEEAIENYFEYYDNKDKRRARKGKD